MNAWHERWADTKEMVERASCSPPAVAGQLRLRAAMIARARSDVNWLVEYCFETPRGVPARQGWMHRQWQRLASQHKRLLIAAPRGHWKTGQIAVARAIWELGNDPNKVIKLLCQSDAKAVKRLSAIREHLKSNKRLHAVFPWLKPDRTNIDAEWNKHMITVTRSARMPDPSIEALGITSSASGDRANLIIADDVVDRRNSITLPKVRESIREAWDDWVNLLLNDGSIIYICTLWHNADLTHDLITNQEWAVAWYEITLPHFGAYVRLPDGQEFEGPHPLWGIEPDCPEHGFAYHGITKREWDAERSQLSAASDDFGPICEVVKGGKIRVGRSECTCGPWTKLQLEERRRELGPRKFARGFSNRPIADDEKRVHPTWIRYWQESPLESWPLIVAIDTATSQKTSADWTGFVVLRVSPDSAKIKVLDAFHRRVTFPDKIRIVQQLAKKYALRLSEDLVIIELASGGRELAEWLVVNTKLPVRGVSPRGNKLDRLDRITPLVESGCVEFAPYMNPQHAEHGASEDGSLIQELLDIPLAEHEDIADAFVHAVRFASLSFPAFAAFTAAQEQLDPDEAAAADEDRHDFNSRVLLI